MRGGSKSPMNLSLLVMDLVDQSPLSTLPNPSSLTLSFSISSRRKKQMSSLLKGEGEHAALWAGL